MLVTMAYGTSGLDVQVPDSATFVGPQHGDATSDIAPVLARALSEPASGAPLRDRVPDYPTARRLTSGSLDLRLHPPAASS